MGTWQVPCRDSLAFRVGVEAGNGKNGLDGVDLGQDRALGFGSSRARGRIQSHHVYLSACKSWRLTKNIRQMGWDEYETR